MRQLKRLIGIVCMLIGPILIGVLVVSAINNIDVKGNLDINKPVPWVIIISIFTPIAIGLVIFGWYAWKGEYDRLPETSDEL
ncbi:MAG TPA: hypothetical protein VGD17_10850 [Chitinophagaceae bacterium]